jgi:O-methyltransferase
MIDPLRQVSRCGPKKEIDAGTASQLPTLSPAERARQLIWPGAMATQSIYVVAKLGIADLLADGSKSIENLAVTTRSHGPTLRRLLRALACLGWFLEDGGGGFENSDLSDTLRSDHPESILPLVIMLGSPLFWLPMGELFHAVRTGQREFDRIYGEPFFDYLNGHQDDATMFNAVMSTSSSATISAIAASYDFSEFEQIVEVGGQGSLLQEILISNPNLRGILYNLPEASADAELLRKSNVSSRCEILTGNFFESVPQGADAYVFKGIIHGLSDQQALTILRNCRAAMKPNGKLILFEIILDGEPTRGVMDLFMLILSTGRGRTEQEFRKLLDQAGFSLSRVIPAAWSFIIEGVPAEFHF